MNQGKISGAAGLKAVRASDLAAPDAAPLESTQNSRIAAGLPGIDFRCFGRKAGVRLCGEPKKALARAPMRQIPENRQKASN
jgi:hypothetical protein